MATMNVSLPDTMKMWVEEQARSGQYSNASDYIRDLIRHDQANRTTEHLADQLREGLADVRSGNLRPADDVLDRLEQSLRGE
ncbi:MAG: addiction module antitoxin [Minwuia thermotolerans]|nr:MAG: addiction module antitoxin [Minwuia thermotolerans]